MLNANPEFKKKVEIDEFAEKIAKRSSVISKNLNEVNVDRTNAQIVFLEKIYEHRKAHKNKSKVDKEKVMLFLNNCIARPSFLQDLQNQQAEIDK
jgi:hypothetical protein